MDQRNLASELHVAPQLSVYYYGFNLTRPPFQANPGLRRALSLVIDRDRLVTAVTGVGEAPAYGWVPRGVWNYTPQRFDYADRPYPARVAEAGGVRGGRLFGGAPAPGRAAVQLGRHPQPDCGRDRLHVEGGARRRDEPLRRGVPGAAAEHPGRKDTQVFRSSWVADFNDAYTFAQLLKSDFGINLTGYSSPRYDALLAAAVQQADPARRRSLLEEAERLMLADHPVLPLYFYVNKHLVKPWVRGWTDNVMNVVYSKDLALGPGT